MLPAQQVPALPSWNRSKATDACSPSMLNLRALLPSLESSRPRDSGMIGNPSVRWTISSSRHPAPSQVMPSISVMQNQMSSRCRSSSTCWIDSRVC